MSELMENKNVYIDKEISQERKTFWLSIARSQIVENYNPLKIAFRKWKS
jgi:hypothetical protein